MTTSSSSRKLSAVRSPLPSGTPVHAVEPAHAHSMLVCPVQVARPFRPRSVAKRSVFAMRWNTMTKCTKSQ